MKYKRLKMSKPIPVMLDQALLVRVDAMSEKIGEAKSTVMRMAMRLGLEDLEKIYAGRSPADIAALTMEVSDEERLKLLRSRERSQGASAAGTGGTPGSASPGPPTARPAPALRPAARRSSVAARSRRKTPGTPSIGTRT